MAPTFIQSSMQIEQEQRYLENMIARSVAFQDNFKKLEEEKRLDDFFTRYEKYSTGELPQDEEIVKISVDNEAVFAPYTDAKKYVTQVAAAENAQAFFGMNVRGQQAKYAGVQSQIDSLSKYVPAEQQEKLQRFKSLVETGLGGTEEDEYGIGSGAIVGFFAGLVSDYGSSAFVDGGELNSLVYEVDGTWSRNKKLQNYVSSQLLDPNTALGQSNLLIGITEEDIKSAPSIPGLAVMLNARRIQYNAGQALAHMSTTENVWQFISDLGTGMITDPDTLAELGITLAAIPVTGGASLGAYGAKRLSALALKGAAKTASKTTKFSKRLNAMLRLGSRGLDATSTGFGYVAKTSNLTRKLLPTTIGEEILIPAVKNYRNLAITHADEITEAARKATVESLGDKSPLFEAFKRTLFTDSVEVSALGKVTSNVIDGAVGELLAYAVSLDDMYDWQRLIYGDEVSYEDYEFSFLGAARAMGEGALFGVALGGLLRLAGGSIQGLSEVNEILEKNPDGSFKDIFAAIRDSRARTKLARERQDFLDRASKVSGLEAAEVAVEHFQSVFRSKGIDDAESQAVIKQMVEYAFEAGVDMHKLVKSSAYDLNKLARVIATSENNARARSRQSALSLIRQAVANNDIEAIKKTESLTSLVVAMNRRRIELALDEDMLPTEVNAGRILTELAETSEDPAIKAEAQELVRVTNEVISNRAKAISETLAEVDITSFDPDMALSVINSFSKEYGFEPITRKEWDLEISKQDEVRADLIEKQNAWKAAVKVANAMSPNEARAKLEAFKKNRVGKTFADYTVKEKAYFFALSERIRLNEGITEPTAPAAPAAPEAIAPRTSATPDEIAAMSQEEFANYILNNGVPEGANDLYKLLTRRPEFRHLSQKDFVAKFKELGGVDRARAIKEQLEELWLSFRKGDEAGIKAIGQDSGWNNFEINTDREEGKYEARHKAYGTIGDFKNMTNERLTEFLRFARDRGYNGQIKFPGQGSKVMTGFDNIVMHGATEADAKLGLDLLNEFWGDQLSGTQLGADKDGKSHTQNLADQLAKDIANRKSTPTAPEAPAVPAVPEAPVRPEQTEDTPYVVTKIEEGHPYFSKSGNAWRQYVFKNAQGDDILITHSVFQETMRSGGPQETVMRVDFEALDKDGDMTSFISTASGDARQVIRTAFSKALQDAEEAGINIVTFGRSDVEGAHRKGAMIYKRLVEEAYPDRKVWSKGPSGLPEFAVTFDGSNPFVADVASEYYRFDRSYYFLTDARLKTILNESGIDWDFDINLRGKELRKALDKFLKDNWEELKDQVPTWDNKRPVSVETKPITETPITSKVQEPANLGTMNRSELNAFIDDNSIPGGKGGTNDAKRQRIQDWVSSQQAVEPEAPTEVLDVEEQNIPTDQPTELKALLEDFRSLPEDAAQEFFEVTPNFDDEGNIILPEPSEVSVVEKALSGRGSFDAEASNAMDATGALSIHIQANSPVAKEGQVRQAVFDAIVKESKKKVQASLGTVGDNDARNPGASYTPLEMAKRTASNLEKYKDRIDTDKLARINKEIDTELENIQSYREVASLIYDRFGIDVGLPRGDQKKGVAPLPIESPVSVRNAEALKNLYRNMRILEEADVEVEVTKQVGLAKDLVAGIRALSVAAKAEGLDSRYVPYDMVVRYLPAGRDNLLFTVFNEAQTVDDSGQAAVFDIDIMKRIAYSRLSIADQTFGSLLLAKQAKKLQDEKATTLGRIQNRSLYSTVARSNRVLFEQRIRDEERNADHLSRVEAAAAAHRLSYDDHVSVQDRNILQGLLIGWSRIPDSPTKERLAKQLGIAGLVSSDDRIFSSDSSRVNDQVRKKQQLFRSRVEEYLRTKSEDPTFRLVNLVDGTTDSAAGYHVGRAAIEALDGTREIGREAGRAWDYDATVKIEEKDPAIRRYGYIGTLDSKTLASLHEDSVKEQVAKYLLFEDEEMTQIRSFTPEDVEDIISYYDEIEAEIARNEAEGWTEESWAAFADAYLQDTFFQPNVQRSYAPEMSVRRITEEIKNFRARVEQRVKMMRHSPPAIVKTLHDEVAGPQSFFGSMFITGTIPGAEQNLSSGVSGLVGMPSAQAVPGSFLQAWNIRSSSMFGTMEGLSKIASLAGAKRMAQFIDDLGDRKLRFLTGMNDAKILEFDLNADDLTLFDEKDVSKILKVTNAADASAQAVTFAQTIFKDYLASVKSKDLDPEQVSFNEFLQSMIKRSEDEWGVKYMKDDLLKYEEYLSEKGDDNYSLVGIEALRRAEHKGFKMLAKRFWEAIPEKDRPADPKTLDSLKLGETPLGLVLRKEVFKPPVMTLPYSAGLRAFKGSLENSLSMIKENPRKYGLDGLTEQELRDFNPAEMADEMAVLLFGTDKNVGLIEEVLKIPDSTTLRSIIQERGITRVNELLAKDGAGVTISIKPQDIVNGNIYTDPRMRAEIKQLAIRYLGMAETSDPLKLEEAGEFVLKQLIEVRNGVISMEQFHQTTRELMKYLALPPEERMRWSAVSSYVATAEHTSRLGYIPVVEQVEAALAEIGVDKESLTPEAKAAVYHSIAHYFNKGIGFGRAYAGLDGSFGIRDLTQESRSHESIGIGDIQLGQYRLADGHEGLFGRDIKDLEGEEYENALRSAVVLDMMMESSSVFMPPSLSGDQVYTPPTLGDFTYDVGSSENAGKRARLSRVAQSVPEKIAEYEERAASVREQAKKNGTDADAALNEEFSRAELANWSFMYEMKKILLQRDEDTGRINTVRNNTWIAADIQSRIRADRPSSMDVASAEDQTAPTKLGIPYLRMLREKIHSEPRVEADILSGNAPFSLYELETASPISFDYTSRVRESGEAPEIVHADADVYADEAIGTYTDAELKAEIEAEKDIAKSLDGTVYGTRAFRLGSRIRQVLRQRVQRLYKLDISEADLERQIQAAREENLKDLRDALISTFGGTSPKDAEERGASSKLSIPEKGVARGRRTRQGRGRSVLSAVQAYGMFNRIDRLIGLALGAVPHSNIRILNPRVDSREAKAKGKNYQTSNRIPAVTPRGPMSIFFRDWTLMGGSHIDAVKNMIRYVYENTMLDDGTEKRFNSYQEAADYVNQRGIFTVWNETVQRGMRTYKTEEAFLENLAMFSEETRNQVLFEYDLSPKTVSGIVTQFNQRFDEAIAMHGLNPRISVVLDSDEKIVFLEILESLQDPKLLAWFRNSLGLSEEYTPERIAVLFMNPNTKDNLVFLPVYEEERVDGSLVDTPTTWGDIVNGMILSDMKVAQGTRPVWTELEMLNMFNMSGNREIIRKILLANRFGIDIQIDLTNSQRLDTGRDRFANNRVKFHGFLNTPRTDEMSVELMEGTDSMQGYRANEHGRLVHKDIAEFLPPHTRRLSDAAYGIAELLRGIGYFSTRRVEADGRETSVANNASYEEIKKAVTMLAGDLKIKVNEVIEASKQIGLAARNERNAKLMADKAVETVENTTKLARMSTSVPTKKAPLNIKVYDKTKDKLLVNKQFRTTEEALENKPSGPAEMRRTAQNGYIWVSITEPERPLSYTEAISKLGQLVEGTEEQVIEISPDDADVEFTPRYEGEANFEPDEVDTLPEGAEVTLLPDDGLDDFNTLFDNLVNESIDEVHKPIIEVPGRGAHGDAYLRNLELRFEKGDGIEYKNMALLFSALTGRNDDTVVGIADSEAIALLEYAIVNDSMRRALFGGGEITLGTSNNIFVDMSFNSQRVGTILNGLSTIRERAKINAPAAAYMLIHEMVERMFAISRQGQIISGEGAGKWGVTINKLKLFFVREFVNERGRKMFREALSSFLNKEEVDSILNPIQDIVKSIKPEEKRRLGLPTGNLSDLTYDQALKLSKTFKFDSTTRGPTADRITEGITQYLTYILFKGDAVEINEARESAVAPLAEQIYKVLVDIYSKVARVGPYKKIVQKGPNIGKPAEPLFLGDPDFPQAAKEGVEFAQTAGNQFVDWGSGGLTEVSQEGLSLLNAVAERAISVMDNIGDDTDMGSLYEEGRIVRGFGGSKDITEETAKTKLAELEEAVKAAKFGSDEFYALEKERRHYRQVLASKMKGSSTDRLHELLLKARDENGNPQMRGLEITEQEEIKKELTYDVLRRIKVERMNRMSRFLTFGATIASATAGGMYHIPGSEFFAIRALGSMLNPEGVNTTSSLQGYIPAQFTQDNFERMLAQVRNLLGDFTVYMQKLQKKSPEKARELHKAVQYQLEASSAVVLRATKEDGSAGIYAPRSDEQVKESLIKLGLPKKIVASLISYRNVMFGEGGILRVMVDDAEADGLISSTAADRLRKKPRLPFQLDRDYLDDPDNRVRVERDVREMMIRNQLAELEKDTPRVSITLLEDTGLLWYDGKTQQYKVNEVAEWTSAFKQMWAEISEVFEDIKPSDWSDLSEVEQVEWTMNAVRDSIVKPDKYSVGFTGDTTLRHRVFASTPGLKLLTYFERSLKENKPVLWSRTRNLSGKVDEASLTPAADKVRIANEKRNRKRGLSTVPSKIEDPGIGGYDAKTIVSTWQNGGNLHSDRLFVPDPRFLSNKQDYEWMNYHVTDISALSNSLFGGNLAEAHHNRVNQGVFGISGFGVRDMISVLEAELAQSESFVPTETGLKRLTLEERKRFKQQLDHLKDQYDVGLNRVPQGVEMPSGTSEKALHLASRFGVTIMSSANWAFSSLSETAQLLANTIQRMVLGDLAAIGDFLSVMSPKARAKLLDQVNLSDYFLNRRNIGIRTGMFYLGELADYEKTSNSRLYDGLSSFDNMLRSFATAGFGKINRYNRYVQARRAVRDLQRVIALGPKFDKFIREAQGKSPKEIRAIGRQNGLGKMPSLSVHLIYSGITDPVLFRSVVSNFMEKGGVDFQRLNAYAQDLIETGNNTTAREVVRAGQQAFSALQFVNTQINIEPRMLSQQVPKTIIQELLASLGQFPALALQNMKRITMMGGLAGVSAWLMSFLLGEAFYGTLQQMVRGESWEDIKEKWTNDPTGASLQLFEKLPFMGSAGQVLQPLLASTAVQFLQRLTDNEEFLSGYQSNPGGATVGMPGLNMLSNWMYNLQRTIRGAVNGDLTSTELLEKFYALSPMPIRQPAVLGIRTAFAESPYATYGSGKKRSKGVSTNNLLNGAYRSRAQEQADFTQRAAERLRAKEAQNGAQVPPEAQMAPEAPEAPTEPMAPQAPKPPDLLSRVNQQEGASPNLVERLE